MGMAVPVGLIDCERGKNCDRYRVRPQLIEPQCRCQTDLHNAVRKQEYRRVKGIAVRDLFRHVQDVHRDEIVRVARKLVMAERLDRSAQRFGLDEPQQDSTDRLEDAIESFYRDTGAKRITQQCFCVHSE